MRLLAPAKLNLHLRVGPRRRDGFHPLWTWMCTVALFDTLQLQAQPEGSASSTAVPFALDCDDPAVPRDETNLVVRAGRALAAALGANRASAIREGVETEEARVGVSGVSVALQKRIPAGAGLGGGSSDGARAMLGLHRLWHGAMDRDTLARLSATLGSDLPFFFYGPSSVCTGRAEIVQPTPAPILARWALLIMPAIALSTPSVYARYDELGGATEASLEAPEDFADWATRPAQRLLPLLQNDLEPAALSLCAELAALRREAEAALSMRVCMTGSGSTLFTLFDHPVEAGKGAEVCARHGWRAVAVEVAPNFIDDLTMP